MTPADAVEAAAQIVYRTSGRKRVMSYEQARPLCEADAREILEAAAPHIAKGYAEAFDEGMEAVRGNRPSANPYRQATK